MSRIKLTGPQHAINCFLPIEGSKSISNRVLLIQALGNLSFQADNLSKSDDTEILVKLLNNKKGLEFDCHHAGTTFRFLTAYFALSQDEQIITGSSRMLQRPVGPLVDALNAIGSNIEYIEKKGFPPLRIKAFKKQLKRKIKIKADVSSQFISALCMIAPVLPHGLTIELEGEMVSKPYIEMTLKIMYAFGIQSTFENQFIHISAQKYRATSFLVESDWSSASYHFSIASLYPKSKIRLNHFFENSLQSDAAILEISKNFGVESQFKNNELIIESSSHFDSYCNLNFIGHPDIAQTVSVMAAGKKMSIKYKGLKTLQIKETNRIQALKNELKKVNINFVSSSNTEWEYIQSGDIFVDLPIFETYDDHRMAMAFAPLACLSPIYIENPEVVSKSYPRFWKDLETMGFRID